MTGDLGAELRRAGVGDVDDSDLARSLYASDASLYRVRPRAVVRPRDADEIAAVREVCAEHGVPLTLRGAGTSLAGNAVGPGVVLDTSRHLHRIREVDPEARTALVEPGVVQADLQRAAAPYGLRFGPDPSTHNRATLGGMIGNNACGSRALGYGRTSDNVLGLDVLTGTGERLRLGAVPDRTTASPLLDRLRAVTDGELALLRTELGRFPRQVSGYSLEHLLPERGFDVPRALVGSEGTLALTLAARVRLVRDAAARLLVVLGYPTMAEAADAVPALLPHSPVACEGLDARITDTVRARKGPGAVPELPRGGGWLLVELAGDDERALLAAAQRLRADAGALDARTVEDPAQAAALWKIREDGAGLVARTPSGEPAHAGWEDAAVPPERLGAYLREFEELLSAHGLTGTPYGHFGDGCVHVRIDFPLRERPSVFRDFLLEAAALVARHGGSLSGEHGDGRARGELLPLMYSPKALSLFARVKGVLDPDDLLNPGVIVRPDPLDSALRAPHAPPLTRRELPTLALAHRHDGGDLSRAVHRCTGVGKCRADTARSGGTGVMCPSFQATRDEKDSTRGRARVLQDVVSGALGPDGWRSEALHDALDLCLACKGCASDCPTGVDMATYKAEALHQRYRRRLRPRAHYALGLLPRWTRLTGRVPGGRSLANAVLRSRALRPLLAWGAGIDGRRELPAFARRGFRHWFARHDSPPGRHGDVVLFVDTFTEAFSPETGIAAVSVLEDAGYRVTVTERPVCCGLTWISTGQLDGARNQARETVRALLPHIRAGATVVGLEPSCTGVLRTDTEELLADAESEAAAEVAAATLTLAELLARTPGWEPPDLSGTSAVAQPHCHHHAVLGWEADAALLREAGADVRRLGGCCGLAGNFGVERGHHEVSVAVAGQQLLPAVREADPDTAVLADGFSCRTQLAELTDRQGIHLARLLARARGLPGG
ncbi:FAD-binding and (Fe-S)-binding domain-containing protein [Streptomyces sp. NPDC048172]|uniref:FAD-binding and (Fe-S)-binding domain-containing protein n=1 Tax=Streptomyces sp. NPDC048172 TaxID=3365505 RepID=UPI0037217B1B